MNVFELLHGAKGWAEHGTVDAARESERLELERQREEKKQKEIDNFKAFDNMVRKAREEGAAAKKEKESLPQEYINIFSGEVIMPKEEVNMFTGEPIIPARESDVVRKARQARWGHVVDEKTPEHTDADMTPAEREERQRVREVCITIGDGTLNSQQADSQRTYRQAMAAKKSSSEGSLFNQSFVNTIGEKDTAEEVATIGEKDTAEEVATKKNVVPSNKEPVFFNQTDVEVINKIEMCRSKNNNSPQQDQEFTNMEELD